MQDRFLAGLRADMRQVDQDAEPVHLFDHVAAKIRQPAVDRFPRQPVPTRLLRVVGDLHDPDAERLEKAQEIDAVFDSGGVLPAQDNADLAFLLGVPDVVGREDLE